MRVAGPLKYQKPKWSKAIYKPYSFHQLLSDNKATSKFSRMHDLFHHKRGRFLLFQNKALVSGQHTLKCGNIVDLITEIMLIKVDLVKCWTESCFFQIKTRCRREQRSAGRIYLDIRKISCGKITYLVIKFPAKMSCHQKWIVCYSFPPY